MADTCSKCGKKLAWFDWYGAPTQPLCDRCSWTTILNGATGRWYRIAIARNVILASIGLLLMLADLVLAATSSVVRLFHIHAFYAASVAAWVVFICGFSLFVVHARDAAFSMYLMAKYRKHVQVV